MKTREPTVLLLKRLTSAVEDGLILLLLGGMVGLAVIQILLRNLLHTGLPWADPTLRVMVLWIALMGAMAATRDRNHIHIDLIARFLPPAARRYVQILSDLFAGSVCAILAWQGGRLVFHEWQDGSILFAGVPAWVCELAIPIGFGVMALRFLLNAGTPHPAGRSG